MAPRRTVADASPSSQRRLRLSEDLPPQGHQIKISRQRDQRPRKKEIQRMKILLEECLLPAEVQTDADADTDTDVETRWERSTRGDAKALWVEQLYRYEEL
ncbi:hypothetical protein CCMA1212_008565 [Trichoderma ghanense]|uniref:Uncharacterized protein n=1 Tax=Trichoderma ghanense TaxID=65468 RepID=A0ABY2GXX1_9HYPO